MTKATLQRTWKWHGREEDGLLWFRGGVNQINGHYKWRRVDTGSWRHICVQMSLSHPLLSTVDGRETALPAALLWWLAMSRCQSCTTHARLQVRRELQKGVSWIFSSFIAFSHPKSQVICVVFLLGGSLRLPRSSFSLRLWLAIGAKQYTLYILDCDIVCIVHYILCLILW